MRSRMKLVIGNLEADKADLLTQHENLTRKLTSQTDAYTKLQQRFKKMQENIHQLVDGPLKSAEATFDVERRELRGRIMQLEQEAAQMKADIRGLSASELRAVDTTR